MATVGTRWLEPLESFLGKVEPSDDDSDEWLIGDLIPRGVAWLLAGKWKGGKTWWALSLAVHVALGRSFGSDSDGLGFKNCLGRPGRVLVIALEDSRRQISKRVWRILRGLDVTPDDRGLIDGLRITDAPIKFPIDRDALVAEVKAYKPDLILIDSLTRAMEGDQNSIKEAGAFTDAWRAAVRESRASIGFLHHLNKYSGDHGHGHDVDPINLIRGSGELLAAPRHIVVMLPIDEPGVHKSRVVMGGNLDLKRDSFVLEYEQTSAKGVSTVRLHDRGDYKPSKAKAMKREAKEQAGRDQLKARELRVLAYAADNPNVLISGSIVAKLVDLATAQAGRLLKGLRDRGEMTKTITPIGRARLCGSNGELLLLAPPLTTPAVMRS